MIPSAAIVMTNNCKSWSKQKRVLDTVMCQSFLDPLAKMNIKLLVVPTKEKITSSNKANPKFRFILSTARQTRMCCHFKSVRVFSSMVGSVFKRELMLLNLIDKIKAIRQNRTITVTGNILVKRPHKSRILRVKELPLVNNSVPRVIPRVRIFNKNLILKHNFLGIGNFFLYRENQIRDG